METPHRNPFEELNDLLLRLPAGTGEELASKLAIQIRQDYATELEAENPGVDGDERWEELLADPRSDILLDRMAEESKQARREGKLEPISALFEEYAHLLDKEK